MGKDSEAESPYLLGIQYAEQEADVFDAIRESRILPGMLEDFLLGYAERRFPCRIPTPEESRKQLEDLLDELTAEDYCPKDDPAVAEYHERRVRASEEAEWVLGGGWEYFIPYNGLLADRLDALLRWSLLHGLAAGLQPDTPMVEGAEFFGLNQAEKLPLLRAIDKKLLIARRALGARLDSKQKQFLFRYETLQYMDTLRRFPQEFLYGYQLGVELGKDYILGYQKSKAWKAFTARRFGR